MIIRTNNRRTFVGRAWRFCVMALLMVLAAPDGIAQSFPDGFHYQAVLRDVNGNIMMNQNVDVQVAILETSPTGTNLYEETHSLSTSANGHVAMVIGTGTPTANGQTTDFSTIDWSTGVMFINLQVDEGATGTFVDVLTTQLFAVPYAMHAKTTDQTFAIGDLSDVNTAGLTPGQTLTWDGTQWIPGSVQTAIDTVFYAIHADTALYADTAAVALNCISSSPSDTANYAFNGDSALYAATAGYVSFADSALYADTALFAWNCVNGWGRAGNVLAATDFIGSTNAQDLIFKTNNTEAMRLTSTGRLGFGTTAPTAGVHVVGDNGFLFGGALSQGANQSFTGERLAWYPQRGHFYAGGGTITLNNTNIGLYSFGSGYNVSPRGDYSTALGFASLAVGESSFAGGYDSKAYGDYSIAFGHVSQANGDAGVAMGRGAWAHAESAIALGYHPHATGAYSVALGYHCEATDTAAFAFGSKAHADHKGSFVFNCSKNSTHLYSNTENQFMVRAVGGTVFYSDDNATTGVMLAPGAGSWSFVSDSTKKRNITPTSTEEILDKLMQVEVSTWNYRSQSDDILHIGPMAQDFYAAYGFGASDTVICSSDIDGVNLAALQALKEKADRLEEQAAALEAAQSEMAALKAERADLLARIEKMEAMLDELLSGTK